MSRRPLRHPRGEQGVVTVLFALLLALFLMIGSIVITIGSWYTHAKHLQTKVDAAALAAAGVWSFPCAPDVDLRIRDTARTYVGEHRAADGTTVTGSFNPQVGGVKSDQIYVTLNQSGWWDDSFPSVDFTDPAGSVCEAKTLDVKATEDDSPLLWGWLPFLPDIKRKARVELEEAHGMNHVLPIAVRVPRPVSGAAVFYDESDGSILESDEGIPAIRYFEAKSGIAGLPAGLEGYSTLDDSDVPASWAEIGNLPSRTGIAIALSFRPACDPDGKPSPCFEDEGFADVNSLCNQAGSGTQIVECFYANGNWPSQDLTSPPGTGSGLHFIRGYPEGSVGGGPPELRGAYIGSSSCESNGYFNSMPVGTCHAQLNVQVELGSVIEDAPGPPSSPEETRKASNVEVRYRLVRADGSTFCDNYSDNCELRAGNADGTMVTYSTDGSPDSPHLPLEGSSKGNAVAIQIRVRGSSVTPDPGACGVNLSDFHNNCRWYHVGSGIFGTSVEPDEDEILESPVQRAFMGNIDLSGPVKWLRLRQDENCDKVENTFPEEGKTATHSSSSCVGFVLDMGLKGGKARDQDEPPLAFTEGTGSSQMGFLDCDPNIAQGQVLTDGVINGCGPDYAPNKFDSDPLCPDQNQFFTLPKDEPFDDWAPFDCVKTRPTGGGNQLLDGLNLRIFGVKNNPTCPQEIAVGDPDDPRRYVRGRNYWHRENNGLYDEINFAWDNDTPTQETDDIGNRILATDPRLVTLFFTPYDSFTGNGQETFPIVALGHFYITGYGRLNGNGSWQGGGPEDPCTDGNNGDLYDGTGNEPPPDLNTSGGNAGGTVVWGHFLQYVPTASSTTGGTGNPCQTGPGDFHPCVAVLVE